MRGMALAVLGPYALESLAGRGGMGEVWRARHADGFPAAVKVLTAARAADDRFRLAFRDEVRAVAALDHPHVVRVYDHGEVGAEAGALDAGAPWFATEWASDGTLRSGRLRDWPSLRDALLTLLDALAHVHARGVLHGDIKPANVLLCGPADLRPGLKLADFGVSKAPDGERHVSGGTAAYMAPEALARRSRDVGPWTDLYAFGAMAWELVSGAPPIDPRSPLGRARAHMDAPLPPLVPKMPVPEGLDGWLRRLLAWDPADRPPFAADARFALMELGGATIGSGDGASFGGYEATSTPSSSSTFVFDEAPAPEPVEPPAVAPAAPSRPPPVPDDWRTAAAQREDLGAMGLALWGLRTVPMVGREAERDALWEALRRCHVEQRPHAVVLRGPTGVGRSRLAAWLRERAQEVGAAVTWRASFADPRGPDDGIGPMLAREAALDGLSGDALLGRIATALPTFDAHDRHALAELLAPTGDVELAPRDVIVLAQRVFEARRRGRIALVCLDDAHLAPEALEMVTRGLRVGSGPVLFVLTARDEEVAERAAVGDRLGAWPTIEVGPLQGDERMQLVEAVLPLERSALTNRLVDQAGGNAAVTVELVGDLVRRRLVAAGLQGYRVVAEAHLPEPGNEWRSRVERALAGLDDEARLALEIAAALGAEVDSVEWAAACELAGARARFDAAEALIAARLARARPGGAAQGWGFAHTLLRSALAAAAGPRLSAHHLACARALTRLGSAPGSRIALHWLEGGDPWSAADSLDDDRNALRRAAMGVQEGAAAVHLLAKALAAIDLPATDRRWVLLASLRSSEAHQAGRADEAIALAREELAIALAGGHERDACRALTEMATSLRLRGRLEEALGAAQQGHDHAARAGFTQLQANAAINLGQCCLDLGRLAEARTWLERAGELADPALLHHVADRERLLGVVARLEGRPAEARARLEAAIALAERSHSRWRLAEAHNALGDASRAAGDLDAAERHYRAAAERFRTLGSGDAAVADLNAALVLLERGAFGEAEALVSRCAVVFERQGRSGLVAATHAVLLPCIAHRGDGAEFDLHVARAEDGLRATGFVEDDIARVALAAGDLWSGNADPIRAARCWALAEDQYRRMGRAAEAEALAARA
jgi:tetratricopeptide (TPR) repeat protein